MRDSPDSFSDGMFVPDKEWNTAYIHVHARQGGGGSDCMHVFWDEP